MVAAAKKTQKIAGRALRTVTRPLVRVAPGRNSGKVSFSPMPGEAPIALLRVQILCCEDLLPKDRGGTSDPFVVVSLLGTKQQTSVIKKTLNPTWSAKDATLDLPIYLSLGDKLGALELLVWDKDMLRKDYLGEHALPLEDWFKGSAYSFDDPDNEPITVNLVSTRVKTTASGSMRLKLGFVQPPGIANLTNFAETFEELVKRSRPSLVSAPPTEGIGTIRSNAAGPQYEDDGLSSDDDEGEGDQDWDNYEEDPQTPTPPVTQPPKLEVPMPTLKLEAPSPTTPESLTPMPSSTQPSPTPPPKSSSPSLKKLPKILRRPTASRSNSVDSTAQPMLGDRTVSSSSTATTSTTASKKKLIRASWANKKKGEFDFNAQNDIIGIVMLEIDSAANLPKLKNMTRTGWDMDPFVVISFGKKVFRTRVIRHSLNPVWDEKLLFHVRKYERTFSVAMTVCDWDKISSNDHIGDASFTLNKLMENVPQKDPETGLYPADEDGSRNFVEMTLPLQTAGKESVFDGKSPTLKVRAKYQPYDALRQHFWYVFIKQYDTDDTGKLSHLELTSMLDSLGSTLSQETIASFWTRYGKSLQNEDELTAAEVVMALEQEICRPLSEKKRIDPQENYNRGMDLGGTSAMATPDPSAHKEPAMEALEGLNFAGPQHNQASDDPEQARASGNEMANPPLTQPTEGVQTVITDVKPSDKGVPDYEQAAGQKLLHPHLHGHANVTPPARMGSPSQPATLQPNGSSPLLTPQATPDPMRRPSPRTVPSNSSSDAEDISGDSSSSPGSGSEEMVERVINVKNCPLCHRPRLNSKAERDIVTHLAVCASGDWSRVDRMLVGNFVTASQAQRKWYTKIWSKGLNGGYKLGANSANIIVQNRMTGQLEEEKTQVYVRLGIRLLYKGARGRMEGMRARKLLKSMSIKQGIKYDSPESVVDIKPFIQFHSLNTTEIAKPLEEYKTFNDFFYRKLKPDARPTELPDNPNRIVSAADCRLMAFETVSEATKVWIKGREFSVGRLLGDKYKDQADRYNGGALVIFRLAPQDYHRFHSPVDGTIGPMNYISGEYYTVNPQAIRTTLDVYGENARKIVPIDSPTFGRVMTVCIGAMMVGSIQTTVEEGQQIKRGEEYGYFAFGGSTVVMLFEPGMVEWDEDITINSRASLETLARVGMGIGWRQGAKEGSTIQ